MSSNIATELKPCPFCGNPPRVQNGLLDCPTCEYPFIGKPGVLLAEMIEKWQQRAPSVSVETKTEESLGKPEAHPEPVQPTGQNERHHILPSAGYWFKASRKAQAKGEHADAYGGMENAYNHVENALAATNDFIEAYFVKGVLRFPDGRSYREHAKELLSRTGDRSLAVGASLKTSAPLTEPASGKFKMSIFENLLEAGEATTDWLVKVYPIGSTEYELGIRLQLAIERAAK